jgi:hypothetical protein
MGSTRPSHHVEVTTLQEGKINYLDTKSSKLAPVHQPIAFRTNLPLYFVKIQLPSIYSSMFQAVSSLKLYNQDPARTSHLSHECYMHSPSHSP